MCNLYSITKGPQAIRDFVRAVRSDVGNMPPLPGVFPDYQAPIVCDGAEGRELVMAGWGGARGDRARRRLGAAVVPVSGQRNTDMLGFAAGISATGEGKMNGGSLLIVRAEVADPGDRSPFDEWYRDEHLPQAFANFEAKRAWRCWSKLDPSVHYAFYEFSDAGRALAVVHSAANKHLGSLFDERWGRRVTRTRDAVEAVHALP